MLLILDQSIKLFFLRYLSSYVTVNTGGAFSVGANFAYYKLIVIFALVVFAIFVFTSKNIKKILFPAELVFAGAISGLIYRFRLGGVVDYIDLKFWPSFNLSDLFIVSGLVILGINLIKLKD